MIIKLLTIAGLILLAISTWDLYISQHNNNKKYEDKK